MSKSVPDASNIPAIQQMLLHAYEWGIENGYITFDGDGEPVFAVPEGKGADVQKDTGAKGMEVKA